jgi:hypothetical protein
MPKKITKFRACPLDVRDVAYIFEEMWHGKSVISGPDDKLSLTRWDKTKPLSYFNTVCMTRTEANTHDKLPNDTNLEKYYGEEIYRNITKHFENETRIQNVWNDVL